MTWALLLAPAAGAMVLLGTERIFRWPAFGVGLVLLLFLAGAVTVAPWGGEWAGWTVYPEDVAFGALMSVAILRLTLGGQLRRRHWSWLLLVAATLASFVLGARAFGLKPAGVEYRSVFYVLAGCLYCASFPVDAANAGRFLRLWLLAAVGLVGLAWFRWSAEFFQLGLRVQWAGVGGDNPLRVLNAGQTFFLSQAFVAAVYLDRHTTPRTVLRLSIGVLLVTILLLQHRSVWVVMVASAIVLAWRERVLRKLLAGAVVAGLLAAPAVLLLAEVAEPVGDSLRSSVAEPFDSRRSTIAWRVALWEQHWLEYQALAGVQTWLGIGFGNSAVYDVGGSGVSHAAHNYYIFALNRMGVLGLALLVASYGGLLRRLGGVPGRWDHRGLFLTLIAGQMVYFVVYSPSSEQGLVAGTALGLTIAGSAGGQGT